MYFIILDAFENNNNDENFYNREISYDEKNTYNLKDINKKKNNLKICVIL